MTTTELTAPAAIALALTPASEPQWMPVARGFLGMSEAKDHLRLAELGRAAGFAGFNPLKTPWCSVFIDIVLHLVGDPGTDSALARDWTKWKGGDDVALADLRPGDIVVISRGSPPFGHVFFCVGRDARGWLLGLGGNQGNAVTIEAYDPARFVGAKRPRLVRKPVEAAPDEKTRETGEWFETCLAIVLEFEGGWSNRPTDPGGATKWGITLNTYSSWRALQGFDSTAQRDLAAMSQETARAIYEQLYWRAAKCHLLPKPLALALFDSCVNHGVSRGVRLLQEALAVEVDGQFGPETMGAAEAAEKVTLLSEFLARRMRFYGGLKTFGEYGLGWSRRLLRVAALVFGDEPAPSPGAIHEPEIGELDDEPIPLDSPNYGQRAIVALNVAYALALIFFPKSRATSIIGGLRTKLRKEA